MSQPTYTSAAAVTPSDTVLYAPAKALFVGAAGNIKVTMAGGGRDAVTFAGVAAGTLLPIETVQVFATGTTATAIMVLR